MKQEEYNRTDKEFKTVDTPVVGQSYCLASNRRMKVILTKIINPEYGEVQRGNQVKKTLKTLKIQLSILRELR